MIARYSLAAFLVLAGAATAGGDKVPWENPSVGPAKAAATGKPLCYYFLTNEITKGGEGGG